MSSARPNIRLSSTDRDLLGASLNLHRYERPSYDWYILNGILTVLVSICVTLYVAWQLGEWVWGWLR